MPADEIVIKPTDSWYKPGKSLTEFHESTAFIRVLVGGRGSGKTTSVAMEAVARHAFHIPGAKILLLRKTELSQDSTTIDTFQMVYDGLGELYRNAIGSLFRSTNGGRNVRLPSQEAVRLYNIFMMTQPSKVELENWLATEGEKWCSHLEFRGIPDEAKRGNKLRGYECSMAILIEADLMELGDFQMLLPCLRWKDAFGNFVKEGDGGIIVDTNPPGTKHWIALLEKAEEGRTDSSYRFWHISTYENEKNLPPRYIERNVILPYRDNPAMLDRMLHGKYADAFDGQPVYSSFKLPIHASARERLPFPLGAYLVRGWDFGTSWAVTWSAYWSETQVLDDEKKTEEIIEYWWALHEETATDSEIEKQCSTVLETTAREFPFWNDRTQCAGILDYCDPAGAAKTDKGSSIEVVRTYGIHPLYTFKDRGLPKTVATVNRLMTVKNKHGQYVFQVDPIGCPLLKVALSGGYRYPKEHEPNYGTGVPLKDGIYDHIADSLRYSVINCLRLAKMPVEETQAAAGQLAHRPNVNPPRRYY
jgi:hypothetical protein